MDGGEFPVSGGDAAAAPYAGLPTLEQMMTMPSLARAMACSALREYT